MKKEEKGEVVGVYCRHSMLEAMERASKKRNESMSSFIKNSYLERIRKTYEGEN